MPEKEEVCKVAHPTYPRVFWDEGAGSYRAEMIDKKTGRIWGSGYGDACQAAIKAAALDQPSTGFIKRAIGWVARHPFIAGAAVGMYLAYRRAKNHHQEMKLVDYLSAGVVAGTIAWAFSKIFKFSGLVPEEVIASGTISTERR